MEKKLLIKDVFFKTQDNAFTWKEIKECSHLFEDNDMVSAYYDENDSSYILNVTRKVLETDKEFEERRRLYNIWEEAEKKNRYKQYLELKKEFSDVDTPTRIAEDLKQFAKEVTSSKDSLLKFLNETGIVDKDGNLTEKYE